MTNVFMVATLNSIISVGFSFELHVAITFNVVYHFLLIQRQTTTLNRVFSVTDAIWLAQV